MTLIEKWLNESIFTESLSPACKLCSQGTKMVVLITGLCPASCYYCPLSLKKGGKDLIFADEWELKDEQNTDILIKEAKLINAKGAGITGGDPLSVPLRTLNYIKFLKDNFGESFHIHLYTSGLENKEIISKLASSGLDEIRFHPMPNNWHNMDRSPIHKVIQNALKTEMDVAIEIPVIPNMEKEIVHLINWADKQQIRWINLNELEFSERNEIQLQKKEFIEKSDISAAAQYSQNTAYKIIESIAKSNLDIGVHYCSASFKDGVQLKNRILRRAKNIATPIEVITDDATILKGIIQTKNKTQLNTLIKELIKTYDLSKQEYFINLKLYQLQIPIPLLEMVAEDLQKQGMVCYISEQYPTHDQLEVERIPLPMKNQ